MKNLTLKNAYLYLVSLISLITILFTSYQLVSDILKTSFHLTPNYYYTKPMVDGEMVDVEMQRVNEENDRKLQYGRVIDQTVLLVVFIPTFVIHYKKTELYKGK